MKKLTALFLCLVLLLSMCACGGKQTETTAGQAAAITVTVVHADGTSKDFSYETKEAYLGAVLIAEGLIQGNDGPYGLEITHVDGEQAIYDTDKAYWALYEGEEYALQGVDTTPVVDGAVYKLVYTGA